MLEFLMQYGYIGLFLACFLAATILPFSSDFIFVGLLIAGLSVWPCILIATLGNWLGGMTNYFLGRLGKIEWIEKYLKIPPEKIYKMHAWLQGKGAFMAFFTWVPFVGDLMAVALGYMRANFTLVTLSMLAGKFSRYVVVMYLWKIGSDWLPFMQ
ncbi:YqaA family protein [Dysgonomonas sp. 520]|uniref:YqaA family protein n=1 Tax=Dysgonomonas sp. 520 TaxID=2302931 RepID=UPI0013D5A6C8|nr:YqaA family protein [Dysgonomonas sp. 520]NDW10828.1 DedA family protein [Dysgonomonas sp. 520]